MKILYIYPHPDDESFGPAPAISKQRRQGHEVYLLTLTKGGATKYRKTFGYSMKEMGDVRYREMQNVARTLSLSGMTVLDLPDSGLSEMDPRALERSVTDEIERIQPDILVTYPVHGISGHPDHITTHTIVKRVFVELKKRTSYVKRLAFHTITEKDVERIGHPRIVGSRREDIDCIFGVDEVDVKHAQQALDCYTTYREAIEKSGIKHFIRTQIAFEFFQEHYDPPLNDLIEALA